MPMMKGIKFACEPCIRGHRSSKCNHSDRVLVQVRKPGRPLSSCPHTLSSSSPGTFVHSVSTGTSRENGTGGNDACGGINCSCDVTSVAIPKIASCACGTSKHHEPPPRPPSLSIAPSLSQSPTMASHSTLMASPISPTSPTIVSASSLTNGSANRINKPQRLKKRNGIAGDGPGRRTSFIGEEIALELLLEKERERSTSAESVKMEKTGSCCGIPNGNGHVNDHMTGHAVQEFVPVFPANIENRTDQFHPQQQQFSHFQNGRVAVGGPKLASITNGSSGFKLDMDMNDMLSLDNWSSGGNESPSWTQSQPTSKKIICCGNKSPQTQLQHPDMHQVPPNPQTHPCCAGGCNTNLIKPPLPIQQQPISVPYGTGQFYPPPHYPPPPYIATPNFQQTTSVWPHPTSTINHPLTPQELAWLQQQRAAGVFGQPPPSSVAMPPIANGAQVDSWAHACNCGPGCDCLGCATHPFNRRTVEYVKGIQQFMEGDYHPHSPHNNSHPRIFPQLSQTQPQQNGFGSSTSISPTNLTETPTTATTADVFSNNITTPTPVASSPSSRNGASHTREEHSTHQLSPSPSQDGESGTGGTPGGTDNGGELSPSNFFYVDYPFGTCAQTEAGCKCGEGCTCVGCLTHGGHDGVVLEGNVDENGQWGWQI